MRIEDEVVDDERHQNEAKGQAEPNEANNAQSDKELLDRKNCLESLAELRQAKWFQVKFLYLKD